MLKKIITLSFSVLILSFAACTQKTEKLPNGEDKLSPDIVNNPATASGNNVGTTDTSKAAQFEFEESTHHFGEIVAGEKVSFIFKFRNSGGAPLVIAQATGSCGCTVPEYSKDPIPSGGKGEIKVTFDSNGKSGMVSKTVTILANTIPATKVLTISAEINQPAKK